MEDAGFKLPFPANFTIPGVTSISADTHKYGYGPKGYSLCLFGSVKLRGYTFFVETKWHGGLYTTPTMAGSRPGATVAGTWVALCRTGNVKYIEYTKEILTACANIRQAIKDEVPEVRLGSEDTSSVVSIISREEPDAINCIALSDLLLKKFKWYLNAI